MAMTRKRQHQLSLPCVLPRLPNEILTIIAEHLDEADFRHMRLVSHQLNHIGLRRIDALMHTTPKARIIRITPTEDALKTFIAMADSTLRTHCKQIVVELQPRNSSPKRDFTSQNLLMACLSKLGSFPIVECFCLDTMQYGSSASQLQGGGKAMKGIKYRDNFKTCIEAVASMYEHASPVPKLHIICQTDADKLYGNRHGIEGFLDRVTELELEEKGIVHTPKYHPVGGKPGGYVGSGWQDWRVIAKSAPNIAKLTLCRTGLDSAKRPHPIAAGQTPPISATYITRLLSTFYVPSPEPSWQEPHWQSLQELRLINIDIDLDNCNAFALSLGGQLHKLTTSHLRVQHGWSASAYSFLRHMTALEVARIEVCGVSSAGVVQCTCSHKECGDSNCWDYGPIILANERP